MLHRATAHDPSPQWVTQALSRISLESTMVGASTLKGFRQGGGDDPTGMLRVSLALRLPRGLESYLSYVVNDINIVVYCLLLVSASS